MYQKAAMILFGVYLFFLGGMLFLTINGAEAKKENDLELREAAESETICRKMESIGIAQYSSSDRRVVPCNVLRESAEAERSEAADYQALDFTSSEVAILQRIVEAEAGGEDDTGKLLVANVVLNRVKSEAFPDTIEEVVFQNTGGVIQFSPVASGSYERAVVSEETKAAVDRALSGEDVSEGALYFAARRYANRKSMRWFDENLLYLFQHGGHEFYK